MLQIAITNRISMPTRLSDLAVINTIKERLQFSNPEYWMRKRRKLSTYNVPQVIQGWQHQRQRLLLPRGWMSSLLSLLDDADVKYNVIDNTRRLPDVDMEFVGELRDDYQKQAVEAMLSRRFCTLSAPTGSGKTVMGLYLVAKRRQPACVIVHTGKLVRQWAERITKFLGIPADEIGYITEGKVDIGDRITIALIQTLHKVAKDAHRHFGHLLIDEVHHCPATTFTKGIVQFDSAFMTGLSATHKRRDGLEPLINWFVGPMVHEVGLGALVKAGHVMAIESIFRQTSFMSRNGDDEPSWSSLITELASDQARNRLIVNDIVGELMERGGPVMVLTDRKIHCEALVSMLLGSGIRAMAAHGSMPKAIQEQAAKALESKKIQVLIATGQLLGEGFDTSSPVAMFLTCPISFSGRLEQYIGRVCRPGPGKPTPRVYDYVDVNVEMLAAAANKRRRAYDRLAKKTRKGG